MTTCNTTELIRSTPRGRLATSCTPLPRSTESLSSVQDGGVLGQLEFDDQAAHGGAPSCASTSSSSFCEVDTNAVPVGRSSGRT